MTRHGPTWHNRHAHPRAATEKPSSSGVEFADDEITGEIDTSRIPPAVVDALRAEREARHRLRNVVDAHGHRNIEHGKRLDALDATSAQAAECAAGARLARRLLRALIAVAILVPGAGIAATKAFLDARDASASASGAAAVERARLRIDIDMLRAEHSALVNRIAPHHGGQP